MFKNIQEFVEGIDNSKKQNLADLSSDQDLSIGIMNLISIEEHLFFSGAKEKNPKFYEMIEPVREIRKEMLQKIIKEYEGEVWCISKHLLAASMRFMEVGTKQQSLNNKKEAENMFEKAYNLYCLFWALNLKNEKDNILQISKEEIKKIAKKESEFIEEASKINLNKKNHKGFFQVLQNGINKLLNCCRE